MIGQPQAPLYLAAAGLERLQICDHVVTLLLRG